jgi:hypothetical protein
MWTLKGKSWELDSIATMKHYGIQQHVLRNIVYNRSKIDIDKKICVCNIHIKEQIIEDLQDYLNNLPVVAQCKFGNNLWRVFITLWQNRTIYYLFRNNEPQGEVPLHLLKQKGKLICVEDTLWLAFVLDEVRFFHMLG